LHFNLVDLALVAIFALAVVDGLRRGIAPYLSELSAFVLGLGLAFALFEPLGGFLHRTLGVGVGLADFGAFLLLLAIGHAVAIAPVQRWAAVAAGQLRPRLRSEVFGAVSALPAFGVAVLVSALVLSALVVLPGGTTRTLVSGSMLGSALTVPAAFIQPPLRTLLVPANVEGRRILDSDPVSNPGEDAFYRLQFPSNLSVEPDPAAEERMLQRINSARADVGVSALRMDPVLRDAARQHSKDMYTRHYFSHQTPDRKSPYDRLRDARFHFVAAGENIAFAPDPDQAWDSLIHSPDHRSNILNPEFRCVGVGAYKGLDGYEEMFTQDFADCT
jgi:uncharacterized protein YkwD